MPLFNWSEKFSVNVPEMDLQHKKLVNLINFFHDEQLAHADVNTLGKVLDELLNYTKFHFKEEEELMKKSGYPFYATQKSEHDELVRNVLDMRKKYYTGDTSIATDIAILLNDWLAEHIMMEDKKYGPYVNSKGE
tara:strand:+ start:326 stop:730 length:405 start_codon:yes stop_codon:yes gene_type:complete